MALSSELIAAFIKATKEDKKPRSETTLYGTMVEYNGSNYVKIDGSDQLTPVTMTTDANPGERVTVLLKDHSAIVTGNVSSPAARTDAVKELGTQITEFEIIVADKVTTQELEAERGRIDSLIAEDVLIKNSLSASEALIDELTAKDVEITGRLEASEADIDKLSTNKLDASVADLTYATIEGLNATNADIYNLNATYGAFENLVTDEFAAVDGYIADLQANKLSVIDAEAQYANIDFANIGEAAIKHLFADYGLIKDIVVGDSTITGELVGVTIKGDLIEGNTVVADKLVIKGEDGLYYKLNTDGVTLEEEQTQYNSIDGKVILAKSITATKIAVDDLVAFDATIGGFNITEDAIYSGVKESATNSTRGAYLDRNGQFAVGDADNYLMYFQDTDGRYKLKISTVDKMEIGGRNLIRNSEDLVFAGYTFEDAGVEVFYDDEGNTVVESPAVAASYDVRGNVALMTSAFSVEDDNAGNVTLYSGDETTGETVEMKTLTVGGITFEVVDAKAREDIGELDDLLTEDKSSLVAALNEVYRTGGSGGGSEANNAKLTVTNTSGWLSKSIAQGSDCIISLTWSSLEDDLSTGNGVLSVYVNNALKTTREIEQGDVEVNVKDYLTAGSNAVRLRVSDAYGNARTLNFNISVVALSITSTFDDGSTYTGSIPYTYTPYGNVTKNMEFWLDGVRIGVAEITTSGRQASFTIPAQSHGSHLFEVFCTAVIDADTIESNHLYYDLICIEEGNTTPIIASSYQPGNITQYDTIQIPYRVYNPAGLTASIAQSVNGDEIATLTVDRTLQIWSYFVEDAGSVLLTISCGDVKKNFTLNATESDIEVEAETEALALYFTSYGRNNNEDHPEIWNSGDIPATLTGFNFVSDGWQLDSDGVTVLRVSGDARVTIPYQIFASDFRTTGKTIEIEFATRDVRNYDAVLFSCKSEGRGLEVTTQRATLTSEQSTIGTQYKEEEHIRLSFVVEKRANNRLLLCYINGILSGAVQYPDADDFSQATPVGITIGNGECTTDIYNIRIYDNDLTRYQILDNWIADTRVASQKRDRYVRNNIYDAYGQITIDTNKDDLPYLVIEGAASPQFKGDKKICSGYYIDPVNPSKSFRFENAEVDVQGTSSQYYYVKNYKIKFKGGFILTNGTTIEVYQMNANSIPTSTFTFKADVASSEGANNVVLAELYNDLCPFKTPPQEADPRVRQTIEGHPIVIFWDYGAGPQFIGKYNFNNDKGTEEVFGFSEGDESWEFLQNGTDRVGFRSADFSSDDWKNDFEARYPEDNVDTTNLAAFSEWVVSTNTEAATGEILDNVNLLNPNTLEFWGTAGNNYDGYISDFIPCKIGDIINVHRLYDTGEFAKINFGLGIIDANGSLEYPMIIGSSPFTIEALGNVKDVVGCRIILNEECVAYEDMSNVMVTIGKEPTEFVEWSESQFTHDTPEYRLAKFKNELKNHANPKAMIFYYVFTEIFLCIDQREKNVFLTLWVAILLWMILFYDADSSLGIDNKGNLAFDYYLEDIDYTEAGDPIFNGQASVLWVNLRKAFYNEILEEYRRLRTTIRNDGSGNPLISYDVVNTLFENHQSMWSEAIYNEDGYHKSIEPLIVKGDGTYLPMLQGKKEQHRKWWLYNRFRYLDSKYITGSSMETRIIIRAHAKANITLKSYVNMYGHVYYNAEMVEHRMFRGQEYEFVWAATGAEDAVIGINDADMLTSLGDLSPLMVELIDISKATHLTELKVGDASPEYKNLNLNSITLGNNVLLKKIDLRNCYALTQAVDASGCTGLEEIYLDNTATTGLTLANGGRLKVLHLPGTITNLTLRNLTALTEFVLPSYSGISTLWLENCNELVDSGRIVMAIASGSRVRLIGVDWAFENADIIDHLLTMRGITEDGGNTNVAVVSGKANFQTLALSVYATCGSTFPYLQLTAVNYIYDTLTLPSGQAFKTKDDALFTFADGAHTTKYTGAEIDAFITNHI